MWFKHLHLYRLHSMAAVSAADLEAALAPLAPRALGNADARRIGWAAPAGRLGGGQLLHEIQGHRLLSALRQERLLPASVIAEELAERVADIEAQEARKVTRKEKTTLKEQITEELLPRAFVRSQKIDVWWDTERQLIGVNTSSRARAEEVLDLLRETLGSLKVTPLATQTLPVSAMTTWLGDGASRPADMQLGYQVVLKAKGDDGEVRARQVDLDSDEIQQLLESGRQASQFALGIEGQLSFVLHDDLAIKSLRFGDALIEEADHADDGDDALARLETDFVLMAGCLRVSVARIIEWLGGEAERQVANPEGASE
ncbi:MULTISPECIES: recombination-associated protein RdgC [unclassified Halomonas]|uniref:recombination-associated protein RdgC n=1 Tax=unclassified Halomonas TaxID=2609666 RepID=UPI00209F3367|nr:MULTISPECIES: recombination-associated protein RdgC [unclassified Halomonas]MCP1313010.1 recombination-associated protein RdgC [Halomonas sp. 707D7]MCP1326090.1 recombination-associated protein RdgC [Halomonas sp. 707D4]